MFEDRRKYPRNPVLLKAVARFGHERIEVVGVNISAANAFFTCRIPPLLGTQIVVDIRPGDLGTAVVQFVGIVVRISPAAPTGFAVVWRSLRSDLGVAPINAALRSVLRITNVQLSDQGGQRAVDFDMTAYLAGTRQPFSSDRNVVAPAQAIHRAPSGPNPVLPASSAGRPLSGANPVVPPSAAADPRISQRTLGSWAPPAIAPGHPVASGQVPLAPTSRAQSFAGPASFPAARPASQVPPAQNPSIAARIAASAAPPRAPTPAAQRPMAQTVPQRPNPNLAQPESIRPPANRVAVAPPVPNSFGFAVREPPPSEKTAADASTVQASVQAYTRSGASAHPSGGYGQNSVARMPSDDQSATFRNESATFGHEAAYPSSGYFSGDVPSAAAKPLSASASPAPERRPVTQSYRAAGRSEPEVVAPIASIRRHGIVDTSPGSTSSGIHALEQQPSATFGSHVDRTAQDKHPPMASRSIQTTSNAYVSAGLTPGPGTPPRVGKAPVPDAKAIQNVNVPVTFVHKNVMVPGRMTGIGAQAAVVVTDETPPTLDEAVVINLPLLVKGTYRTVYLSGKLLQIGTPTDEGMRFMLHIEKCEEGNHKGAFAAFLAATH